MTQEQDSSTVWKLFSGFDPQVIQLIKLDPEKLERRFFDICHSDGLEKGKSWAGTVGGSRNDDRPVHILGQTITVHSTTALDFPAALISHWEANSEKYFPDEQYRKLAEKAIKTFLVGFAMGALGVSQYEVAANTLNFVTDGGFTNNSEFMAKISDAVERAQDNGDVLFATRIGNLINRGLEQKKGSTSS